MANRRKVCDLKCEFCGTRVGELFEREVREGTGHWANETVPDPIPKQCLCQSGVKDSRTGRQVALGALKRVEV